VQGELPKSLRTRIGIDGGCRFTHPDRSLDFTRRGVDHEKHWCSATGVEGNDRSPVCRTVSVVTTHAENHLTGIESEASELQKRCGFSDRWIDISSGFPLTISAVTDRISDVFVSRLCDPEGNGPSPSLMEIRSGLTEPPAYFGRRALRVWSPFGSTISGPPEPLSCQRCDASLSWTLGSHFLGQVSTRGMRLFR
jgi:hypothetical protein